MNPFHAIAAISLNRVIGRAGRIPWHLPEDFKWFKQVTMGHVLVMGRTTFQSIGRPLPGRETIVLTRSGWTYPGIKTAGSLESLPLATGELRTVFICGGAEVYRKALPLCSDLFLTVVQREIPDGDAFFPDFEQEFAMQEVIQETPEFSILHFRRP